MDTNHVIIAHNNQQFLEGIVAKVLKKEYEITKQFMQGVKALRYILREAPDVAVLQSQFDDISAFEIINETRAKGIDVKFIVIFPSTNHKEILLASKMNLAGSIYAGEVLENLLICFNTVIEGDVFVSKKMSISKATDSSVYLLDTLSNSEMKILTLISIYQKSSKISSKLDISIRTIEKHRSNIIKKLDINIKEQTLYDWVHKNKEIIQSLALNDVT